MIPNTKFNMLQNANPNVNKMKLSYSCQMGLTSPGNVGHHSNCDKKGLKYYEAPATMLFATEI